MKTKQLITALAIICSLTLLTGCGGNKTAEVPSDTEENTQVQDTTMVDATREQCLQMTVYGMQVALAQGQGDTAAAETAAQKGMNLEKKFIADNIEYEQACEKYMTDQSFMQDVQKRLQE